MSIMWFIIKCSFFLVLIISIFYLISIMAILLQGILGGISGKIGNVIGSSWKGIPVIKSRPLSVSNPRTSGQIEQRSKMTNVVAFAQLILSGFIKPLWDRFAQQASGYNDFVSANIDLFTTWFADAPANFVLSKGKMTAVIPNINSVASTDANITITWNPALPDSLALATDEAYVLLVNETQENISVSAGLVVRSAGTAVFPLVKPAADGDVLRCYLAFRRADGTVVSDSGYSTSVIAD